MASSDPGGPYPATGIPSGWSAYIAVCIATTAPWMGGRSPSSRVPSSPTRTTMEAGWSRSEGPAVKYISSAPGTRTLALPCPFAEIAPLATTRPAKIVVHDAPPRNRDARPPAAAAGAQAQRIDPLRSGQGQAHWRGPRWSASSGRDDPPQLAGLRVARQGGNGIGHDLGIGQPGPGQRRAQLLAQARHAGLALQQHLHGHAAGGLAYLVVEHIRLGQQDRPQRQRMDLRVAVAQDVVGPSLHSDPGAAVARSIRLPGERA